MRTFGRLRFGRAQEGAVWAVDNIAPHVAIAFKRLFTKVRPTLTKIIVADNLETRADLHWFMQRYPFETNDQCRQLLQDGVDAIEAQVALRGEILDINWTPPPLIGFREGEAPYKYQSQAAAIALANPGLLLGDDVGLGKTVSAFAMACSGAPLPMAIVVQPHLVDQWARKARKFTTLRVHVIKQGTPYNLPVADLYVFAYTKTAGWIDWFRTGYFKSVVYDEIQELRHGTTTGKGLACRVLSDKAALAVGLSATPIYNYGDEMHTIMSYISPGLLGTREEFLREWCTGKEVKDPDALGSFLASSGFLLRRDEDDPAVDASMPPPNILDFELEWSSEAMDKEADLLARLADTVLTGKFQEAGEASRQLDVRMRHLTGVSKAKQVAAYTELLLRDVERVILAGWHHDVYDIWRYALQKFDPVEYTGRHTPAGKLRNVERFCGGGSRVLFMSLRSGAGLDGLQHYCKTTVFGELDWSPKVHYQLIGRTRRPGQDGQVDAHYLHCNGGSDPVLMSMLGVKSDQSRGIMDPGKMTERKVRNDSRIKALARYVLENRGA